MGPAEGKLKTWVPQGVDSKTWTPPPVDGHLTMPELYAFHAEHSAEHPVIVYDDEHGEVQTLRYKDVFPAVKKAAKVVVGHVENAAFGEDARTPNVTLGILAVADFQTLWTLILGTMYAGHTPFPISIRNSAPAVAHLLRKTSVSLLLVSADSAMQRLAHETKDLLAKEQYDVQLLPLPTHQDFYNAAEVGVVPRVPASESTNALILHSSGSTSFPKPIPLLHRNFVKWGTCPCFSGGDWCDVRVSMHCLPMFHMMGMWTIAFPTMTGMVIGSFRPSSPPIMSTVDTVLNAAVATKCAGMFCMPVFIEVWARDPARLAKLQNLKFITNTAAPLRKEVGDMLLEKGISMSTGFGATEYGPAVHWDPFPKTSNWEYFTYAEPIEYVRRYQEGLPGIFEPVILESQTWSPSVFNCEIDGRRGFATNDLLREHPENPNLYRVYGRADDQIALSTGEKTNPVPMEATLLQDPHVQAALMFGQGRFQNGVIIHPKEPFDPRDEAKLEAFRNSIWPTVERANSLAPSHSRIFKEMITVTSPSKPFQYTPKGSPRRQACLADYSAEIEEVYKKVEESAQTQIAPPASWSEENVRRYVQDVVRVVLNVPGLQDGDDLFHQGCDSLKATWIRNTILHTLRTAKKVSVHGVPQSFVYTNPSIDALTRFLCGLVAGKTVDKAAERAARLQQMAALVDKYGGQFPKAAWSTGTAVEDGEQFIVLTGTTGGVGSQLLARLLEDPRVARVYALNRDASGESKTLEARQRDVFKTWGLDDDLLSSAKVSFHVADFGKPDFALHARLLEEIRGSVTGIIHSAWRVDFNVALPSFEPLVAGTRNLLNFALTSPRHGGPRVLFVSSVSALHNYAGATPAPETLDLGPEVAVGQGYGESKWVAEQVLWRARRETGLRTTSVRVGQLSGDSRNGGWNTKEWVPAIVRASKGLGCAPALDGKLAWVPIDVAGAALLEMLPSDEPVLHLTAARSVAWKDVFGPVAERLGVPLVPASEWLEKLQASARAVAEDHRRRDAGGYASAHALVEFFAVIMSGSFEETQLGTTKSFEVARSLAALGPLGREDVLRWVAFWERVGFLKT